MTAWQPMATAPRDGRWVTARTAYYEEIAVHYVHGEWLGGYRLGGRDYAFSLTAEPLAWHPAPACASCGAAPAQAHLAEAGSEYWPERRAELTCDACSERLTLAAERFRRAKGWTALQERLTYAWPGGRFTSIGARP